MIWSSSRSTGWTCSATLAPGGYLRSLPIAVPDLRCSNQPRRFSVRKILLIAALVGAAVAVAAPPAVTTSEQHAFAAANPGPIGMCPDGKVYNVNTRRCEAPVGL
jgi:hypothetical protein